MSAERKENLTVTVFAIALVLFVCWSVPLLMKGRHDANDRSMALHAYSMKTGGHLEQYESGSHVESRYAGTVPAGEGKGSGNSVYLPVEVKEWSDRIIYFDGRPPYYPEDHEEWLEELGRIRKEHGDK